jgi:hypothetical protein
MHKSKRLTVALANEALGLGRLLEFDGYVGESYVVLCVLF